MKKWMMTVLCAAIAAAVCFSSINVRAEEALPAGNGCEKREIITGEDGKYRLIITTDAEVDDFNSFLMLLLFANDFDIDGIVYSSSFAHWNGDGVHTQGEINPSINSLDACMKTIGQEAVDLKSYRPMDMEWFSHVIDEYYRADYGYLVQNDPRYPDPDELLSKVKVGNVEFQGDVRFDTEGSDLIKNAILDDDERTLFLSTWGGFNTVCRALISIHEEYGDSEGWEELEKKIGNKVILCDYYQDNSYVDNHIAEIYPDIHSIKKTGLNLGYFRGISAPEQYRAYYKADQMRRNFLIDHGELMGHQFTIGDGQVLDGELDIFQYGLTVEPEGMEGRGIEQYDHLAWTDMHEWIMLVPTGLRGLENGNLGSWGGRLLMDEIEQNRSMDYTEIDPDTGKEKKAFGGQRFMGDMLAEFVARADWAANPYEACNHAPVLNADSLNLTAGAGDTVTMSVQVSDPDGDELEIEWMVYNEACEYYGTDRGSLTTVSAEGLPDGETVNNSLTIPADAESGDYFVVICRAKDRADAPMTRYAEFVIEIS